MSQGIYDAVRKANNIIQKSLEKVNERNKLGNIKSLAFKTPAESPSN